MSAFTHVATISGIPHSMFVTSLEVAWIDGVPHLFTGSAANGGLASYQITSTGLLFRDQIGASANRGTYGLSDIEFVTFNNELVLVPSGRSDDRFALHEISSTGQFESVSILGADPSLIGGLQKSEIMTVNGKTYMVSSQWGQSGFQLYRIREDNSVEYKRLWEDTDETYAGDITDMTTAVIDGRTYFFVTSAQDTGVTCYWMGQWGNVRERGSIGVEDGLWVSAPTALATAQVAGQAYLIVGAAGSNSLTVIKVNAWGGLFVDAHYLDSLNTRFGNIQALDTFEIGNRAFLVAGGGDDGISLFEINPDGSLFHIESLADSTSTALMDLNDLTAVVLNGVTHIFATGSDNGISQLRINLSNMADSKVGTDNADTLNGNSQNDLLVGRDGDDILSGRGGDDRLIDGAGVDTLYGGAGADVFIFVDDNRLDVIADFDPARDVIDLTAFPMLYTFSQLQFTQRDYGVLLTIGDDRFQIIDDDRTLLVSDLAEHHFRLDF